MTRAQKVEDAQHYSFILDRELLKQFKKLSRTTETGPADVLRIMIQNYVDATTTHDGVVSTTTDVLFNAIDTIHQNIDEGFFLLNKLERNQYIPALNALSHFHSQYVKGGLKGIHNVSLNHNEFLTIRQVRDNKCVITSSAHQCKIHYDDDVTIIEMSDTYTDGGPIHRQCVVNDLLTTLRRIGDNYRTDLTKRLNNI